MHALLNITPFESHTGVWCRLQEQGSLDAPMRDKHASSSDSCSLTDIAELIMYPEIPEIPCSVREDQELKTIRSRGELDPRLTRLEDE
jgi:hypothetical protein